MPLLEGPAAGPQPGQGPPPLQFMALFTAVMLPMFMGAVDQTLLATATPRIAAELGGLEITSWISIGYLMAVTIMAPLYGRAGDRYGRRKMLLIALGVFVAGSLVCALARNMPMLIAARVVQGLGGGGLMVMSHSLIGELVTPRQRPRYQGWFALIFTAASVGGPVLGGFVVHHGDWRWLFLANLPLGMLAAWRILRLPPSEAPPPAPGPFDAVGVVLFAVFAGSVLVWLSQVGNRFALLSGPSAQLLALAAVSGVLLARHQLRHAHPFLPLDILRIPGMRWICATAITFSAAMFAMVFLLPIYVQVALHANAVDAGLQLLPLTIGMVVGSISNSRILVRTGQSGRLPPYGLALAAVALLCLAVAPPSQWGTALAEGACGLGFGVVMPNAQLGTQTLAGRHRLGAAAALIQLTRSCGASLGTAAFGGLAFVLLQSPGHRAAGGGLSLEGIPPAQAVQAFHIVFGVVAVWVAAGAWAASRVPILNLADSVEIPKNDSTA